MPNFDFKCESCGHVFETMTESGRGYTNCHKCGLTAHKQPSAPSFRVKGYNAENGYTTKTNVPHMPRGK